MKTWTKPQIFTVLACIALLVVTIPIIDIDAILALHKGINVSTWVESFRQVNDWFYFLYQRCLFILVAIVILVNRNDLSSLNMDRRFILLFAYSGLAYCSAFFWPTGWAAGLLSILLVITYLQNKFNFDVPVPNLKRIMLLILAGFVLGILLIANRLDAAQVGRAAHWLLVDFPPFAVMEEVIFRSLPWMLLKKLNWPEPGIFIFQAVLFWLSHTTYLFTNPIMFWGIVPTASLLLGFIVWRSRSVTPSAIAHILFNVLAALMQTFR